MRRLIFAIAYIFIIFIASHCENGSNAINDICVPQRLFNEYKLCLGDRLSDAKKNIGMQFDDSDFNYVKHMNNNKYFEYLEVGNESRIKEIVLFYATNYPKCPGLKSKIKEIVQCCIDEYGNNYSIFSGGQIGDDFKNSLVIIWFLHDNRYAIFKFNPNIFEEDRKIRHFGMSFVLSHDLIYDIKSVEEIPNFFDQILDSL